MHLAIYSSSLPQIYDNIPTFFSSYIVLLVKGSWETAKAVPSGEFEHMKCDLVSISIHRQLD